MTRFRDIRKSVVKGSVMDSGIGSLHGSKTQAVAAEEATVQRISQWDNGDRLSGKIRDGIIRETIVQPTHNRQSRRKAQGHKKTRSQVPPHPLKVMNQAHQMQRSCRHLETYEDQGRIWCKYCHLEVQS